jgi:hypothetical protein
MLLFQRQDIACFKRDNFHTYKRAGIGYEKRLLPASAFSGSFDNIISPRADFVNLFAQKMPAEPPDAFI